MANLIDWGQTDTSNTGIKTPKLIDWGNVPVDKSIQSTSSAPIFSSNPEMRKLQSLALRNKVSLPKEQKVGVLSKLLGLLSSGETAPGVYETIKTGDIGKGVKKYGEEFKKGVSLEGLSPEKKTYADVLELIGMPEGKIAGPVSARGTLGLLGDIFLDPTTYAGAGVVKQLSKGTKKVLSPLVKTKTGQGAIDFLGRLFKPGYEVSKLGKEGDEFLEMVNKLQKGTRSEVQKTVEEVSKLAEKTSRKYGKVGGRMVGEVVETGKKSGFDLIDEVADTIAKRSKEIGETEKTAGLLKNQVSNYLRHYITPEARELLEKYGPDVMTPTIKKYKVVLGAAKNRKIAGTIEEINKEFVKKQGINLFEPDAFKAWAGREAEHIKAIKMDSFLKEVEQKFGVKGTAPQIIDGIRYVPYQPKGALKFYPLTEGGVGVTKKVKTFLLPEPIANHLSETSKALSNDETIKGFFKIYDKALNFWKGSVTGWFPAFHGRNFMGGTFNNFIAGVKNPLRYLEAHNIARGKAGEIITKAGKKISYDDIRKMVSELGVSGQPGYLDVFKTIEEVVKESGETGVKKAVSKTLKAPRATMEFIEDRLRIPLFIDRLIKGDTAEQAAKKVMQFHFDYAPEAFTPFERNVMKRLIPFYTWTRNNIPLQLSQMAKQPGKYAAVAKTLRSLRGEMTGEDIMSLPSYMRDQFPMYFGESDGKSQFAYGLGLPIEEIGEAFGETPTRTAQKLLSKANPLAKMAVEIPSGQSLYFNRPLSEMNIVSPFLTKIPGMKQLLDIREETDKYGNPKFITSKPEALYLVNTLLGRMASTGGRLTDDDLAFIPKVVNFLFGVKTRSLDLEQEATYREKEQIKEIEKYLERKGLLKKFERYYKPKK